MATFAESSASLVAKTPAGSLAQGASGVSYTCPMLPEVRQRGPCTCPICGMALALVTITVDTGPNAGLTDMTRRFWVGSILTVPVFGLEMGAHLTGLMKIVGTPASRWIQFALSTPVILWASWPFLERGRAPLRSRHLNMFTLNAMGVGVARRYNVAAHVVSTTVRRLMG